MAAPILSNSKEKYAISVRGKNKKKKVTKNVLSLPTHLPVGVRKIELDEIQKLNQILVRLLPMAKIPSHTNTKLKKVTQTTENFINESDIKLAKSKRSQLSIGVNEVNKSLKKKILSAVLLADDIQPKFLVHHLNLLCTHNKIPFLTLPKFRDLTKTTLGFPCIVLGFKKNFNVFLEAVNEIKKIYESQNAENKEKNAAMIGESEEEKTIVANANKEGGSKVRNKVSVTEFIYLNRSSKMERTFTPENHKRKSNKSEIGFISIPKDNNYKKDKQIELSYNKKRKNKMSKDLDTSIEESNVPEKRIKKNQMIDKVEKKNFRYFPTNLIRTQSNPDRISKKNK